MNFLCQTCTFRNNSLKKKWIHLIYIMLLLSLLLSAISCAGTSKTNIATVQTISAGTCYSYSDGGGSSNRINVILMPSSSALANKVYKVDLYEKGKLRDTTTVSWNQPEINVQTQLTVCFNISYAEYNAYLGKDISGIFTVKVHE